MFLNLTVILKHHCRIKPGVIGLWVLPSLELARGGGGSRGTGDATPGHRETRRG